VTSLASPASLVPIGIAIVVDIYGIQIEDLDICHGDPTLGPPTKRGKKSAAPSTNSVSSSATARSWIAWIAGSLIHAIHDLTATHATLFLTSR
jgi:hypothetical protein